MDELKQKLAEYCEGLLYPSETDSPLEPISELGVDGKAFLSENGALGTHGVKLTPYSEFWSNLHSVVEGEPEIAARWKALEQLLDEHSGPACTRYVLRRDVGDSEVTIYVLIARPSGGVLGFKTTAVQT